MPVKGYPIATDKKWLEGRSKVRTGFCSTGLCEGTKPTNFRGRPLKTCPMFLSCPCSCHLGLDKMFALSETPRILMSNPDYKPDMGNFVMPDMAEVARERAERARAEGRIVVTDMAPEEVLSGNAFHRTESGVRAKGQLEYQTFTACANLCWPSEMTTITPMTPKFIAEYISRHEGIEPPSSGAIQAAWDRWKLYGLIEDYGRKPVRFLGFKGFEDARPTVGDLDAARLKYKRTSKLDAARTQRHRIMGKR